MGISPRIAFAEPNQKVLALSRKDGDNVIVYAYNMMYTETEPFFFQLEAEGRGKPYRLCCSTGEVEEVGCYKIGESTIILDITLAPGEACLYVINTAEEAVHAVEKDVHEIVSEHGILYAKTFESGEFHVTLSDGAKKVVCTEVPESIRLEQWELEVEDWNEGKKIELTEDRGKDHVTKEVYYETSKEKRSAGKVALKPWKDIAAIGPEVSGVGYYKTVFTLPENWDACSGAVLQIESTNKNTAAVYVNGVKAPAFDISRPETDITELVRTGENEVLVEVSSTLNNRLLARGYFDKMLENTIQMVMAANNAMTEESEGGEENAMSAMLSMDFSSVPHDYGMVGEVKVAFYKKAAL